MKLRKLNTNGDVVWAESKIREVKRLKVVWDKAHKAKV